MVKLINKNNVDFLANIAYSIMRLQEHFTHIKNINYPKQKPCIFAMWHANQMLVHGLENRAETSILVSNSADGEIVARAVEKWGFKAVRGSSAKKGAVEATMKMISRLNNGEFVAIMVDGPSGPLHKVKNGALKLAQKTGTPIIPVCWYSSQKSFVYLPSWDKMTFPVGHCNILNIYGDPVYLNENATDEEFAAAKENIQNQLLELEKNAPNLYKEACKSKLWKK